MDLPESKEADHMMADFFNQHWGSNHVPPKQNRGFFISAVAMHFVKLLKVQAAFCAGFFSTSIALFS